MSKSKRKTKQEMIADARKAAEILASSPLASKLKAHGITRASMAKEADDLSQLQMQIELARTALAQASDAFAKRFEEFAQKWAAYANLVRGLTTDEALRNAHGVSSPGVVKGPRFHRKARVVTTPADPNGAVPTGHA